ncbi:hypothetical protein HTZ85_19330 [Escherichia coli]|nr:hypothetical protein [Escherichia coli]
MRMWTRWFICQMFRALNRALRDAHGLRFVIYASTGMEMLVENYGIMLRIQYKQNFLTGCHPCWNRVKMFISFRVTISRCG